jgi:hypothetical protein
VAGLQQLDQSANRYFSISLPFHLLFSSRHIIRLSSIAPFIHGNFLTLCLRNLISKFSEIIRLLSLDFNPKFSLLFIETRTEIEPN